MSSGLIKSAVPRSVDDQLFSNDFFSLSLRVFGDLKKRLRLTGHFFQKGAEGKYFFIGTIRYWQLVNKNSRSFSAALKKHTKSPRSTAKIAV